MQSVDEWYSSLPRITRKWLTVVAVITILCLFDVLDPALIAFIPDQIMAHFHFWRLLTNFFFIGVPSPMRLMKFIFDLTLFVRYSTMLERGYFSHAGGAADYLALLTFGGVGLTIVAFFRPYMYFLLMPLVFLLIYVWSRKDPMAAVEFYGFRFSAWHMPFLYLLVMLIFQEDIVGPFIGMMIGHVYHFITDIVPKVYGVTLFYTPKFYYDYMDRGTVQFSSTPAWMRGQGHRLT